MSTPSRKALGDAGLHIIHSTGEALRTLDRQRIRAGIEEMRRPAPGTSEILSRPLSQEIQAWNGKDVSSFDLVGGLAPMHLLGGEIDRGMKEKREGGKKK